jgi:hypothetical protein
MLSGCPGAGNIKGAPSIKVKTCPECGSEIELFSCDSCEKCRNCGFVAYNDMPSCISWCKYAPQCVGEEIYERFMTERQTVPPAGNAEGQAERLGS